VYGLTYPPHPCRSPGYLHIYPTSLHVVAHPAQQGAKRRLAPVLTHKDPPSCIRVSEKTLRSGNPPLIHELPKEKLVNRKPEFRKLGPISAGRGRHSEALATILSTHPYPDEGFTPA
jgi:hypothetical protein